MALSKTQADAIYTEVYGKKFKENVYDVSPFLKLLKDNHRIKVKGGTRITFPIQYKALGTGENRGWNEETVFKSIDTWTQGVLEWAHTDAHTLITKEERFKNQAGPQQIVDIVKQKAKQLEQELAHKLAQQIFATTAATGAIAPIPTILDDSDAYAGIDPSDASVWKAEEDASSTKMTRALLYLERGKTIFQNSGANVHFTTQAMLGAYNALLGADERYHNTKQANAGFKTITLYGDSVYADTYISAGHWYGLELEAFELHVMSGVDGTPSDWEDLLVGGFPKALAKYVDHAANLVCYRRRTNFKLTALTGT